MTNNTVDVEYLSGVAFTVVTFRQGYDMDEVEDLLESLKPSVSIVDRQEKIYDENDFPLSPQEIRGKINELTKVSFQPAYDIIEVQQIVAGAAERAEEWLAQCLHERQEELDRIEAERLEQELIAQRESERIAAEQEAALAAERAEQRRVERLLEAEHRREEQESLKVAPLPPIPTRKVGHKPQHAREAYGGEEVESSRSLLELIAYLHYVTEKGGERGAQFSVVSSVSGGYFGVQSITIDANSRQVILDAQGMDANEALTVSELASQLREIRDQNKNFGLYQVAVWGGRFGIQGIKSLEIATGVGIVVIRTN